MKAFLHFNFFSQKNRYVVVSEFFMNENQKSRWLQLIKIIRIVNKFQKSKLFTNKLSINLKCDFITFFPIKISHCFDSSALPTKIYAGHLFSEDFLYRQGKFFMRKFSSTYLYNFLKTLLEWQ